MPRGPAPQWTKRKEPVLDHLIMASINHAGGVYDQDGHYGELHYTGIETRERAKEIIRALHRCAHYLHKHGVAAVGMHAEIIPAGNGYTVRFWAVDKTIAQQHILDKYGPDRSKWPYDPRRKGNG